MQIKICGITRLEDARYAVAAGATHLGFIQDPASPRYIEAAAAAEIIEWVYGAEPVGVFVDETAEKISQAAEIAGFKWIQLHGSEPPEVCKRIHLPVIKVLSIDDDTTRESLQDQVDQYSLCADWLMFDTSRAATRRSAFDWTLLTSLKLELPYFLAGGLNSGNVVEAIAAVGPGGIDLSSGLEEAPGVKDFDKIDAFFEAIREREL